MSSQNNFGWAYFMLKNWMRSPASPEFQISLCITEINTFHTKQGAIELVQFGLRFHFTSIYIMSKT